VEGKLNGTINYSGKIDTPVNGSGESKITISKGMLKLTHPLPVLDLDTIEFDECAMVAQLKGRRLNITSGTLKGKDMIGNMTGSISLRSDIPESRLNLKGEIEIYPSLFQDSPEIRDAVNQLKKGMKDGKLSFNITGTIDSPKFNFN
jgi:type II secretion system protein N